VSNDGVFLPPTEPAHAADPVPPTFRHEPTSATQSVNRATTSGHQREVHRVAKKPNPLAIVRLNDRAAVEPNPSGVANRAPGLVAQNRPTGAPRSDNDFFLTRFFGKIFGN
jgi:hypothetical protein